jgi:hypothetical protein
MARSAGRLFAARLIGARIDSYRLCLDASESRLCGSIGGGIEKL